MAHSVQVTIQLFLPGIWERTNTVVSGQMVDRTTASVMRDAGTRRIMVNSSAVSEKNNNAMAT